MGNRKTSLQLLIFSVLLWTVVLCVSLFWNMYNENNQAIELATIAARENFNKDQAFRLWGLKLEISVEELVLRFP